MLHCQVEEIRASEDRPDRSRDCFSTRGHDGRATGMDEKNQVTEQMPASIGRYKVLEVVGFGAMGAVYRAVDPVIKRTLAIKAIRLDIPKQSPQYRAFIERFYREAEISGTLSHPNIVTLF